LEVPRNVLFKKSNQDLRLGPRLLNVSQLPARPYIHLSFSKANQYNNNGSLSSYKAIRVGSLMQLKIGGLLMLLLLNG
jgi:hypothetical protein